ncbi:MAG: ABC transporter permease [Actinomycetota bacterium]|nr:ABC transporter permease [Actinomycetota bacterium]
MTGAGIATVARQEFRLRIRAGRWKVLLGVFFAILLAFTALLRAGLGQLASDELPYKGTILYGGLMLFVLGLALLVVPALAAQSVNGDRERGTLATLQVTRLTAADITLGKFAAAWGTALVFLALTFPLVAYAMTQGGVPLGRVLVVTTVLALLLGTVCAVSLWLSSVLSRTTTSGVLAYLAVFALTIGTLITFGILSAVTTETYTASVGGANCFPACDPGPQQTYTATRARTDRTWVLLAPNPFVVLADAAPQLPDERRGVNDRNQIRARDLDPLGQIGRVVRDLRETRLGEGPVQTDAVSEPDPVWPTGLAINVVLGAGALWLTTRRLRTPSRKLPKGQRVA